MTPGPFRVRPATREDLPQILATEESSFSTPWSRGTFEALLPRAGVVLRVLEVSPPPGSEAGAGRVVAGHGILWAVGPEAEVANLAVAPAFRGSGGGALLLDVLLAEAGIRGVERVFLEVRASNPSALALYRSRGFKEIGVRKDYYRKPREDALVLALDLQSSGESGTESDE
jgi:ribosomal-protein-alanine N-acetyltransferase